MSDQTSAARAGAAVLALGLCLFGPQAVGVAAADGQDDNASVSARTNSAPSRTGRTRSTAPAAGRLPGRERVQSRSHSPDQTITDAPQAVPRSAALPAAAAPSRRSAAPSRDAEPAGEPAAAEAASVPAARAALTVGESGLAVSLPAAATPASLVGNGQPIRIPPFPKVGLAGLVGNGQPIKIPPFLTAGPSGHLVNIAVSGLLSAAANWVSTLPTGELKGFLEGAVLLTRRQWLDAPIAPTSKGTDLALPASPTVAGMVRDLSVAATGAQELTLSWGAPTPTAGTPTGYTVIVETTPTDPSQDPTLRTISTTNESVIFDGLSPIDQYVFSVAAVYDSSAGAARTVSYSATDSFLALTSFLNHPTAMLATTDGSMWIAYQANVSDYLIKRAVKCLGGSFCNVIFAVIPGAHWIRKEYKALPDEVKRIIDRVAQQPPPESQVRQYKLVDGQWTLQTAIVTAGRPQALAEDTSGNIWVASDTGGLPGVWGALFPDVKNNTGLVQRITSQSGPMHIADTIEVFGSPTLQSLAASPDGSVWVGTDIRNRRRLSSFSFLFKAKNGAAQQIYRTDAGDWTANPSTFLFRHPPVGLTVGADGNVWAVDTVKNGSGIAAYFGINANDLALKSTLTRIDPVTGERTDTNVGRGGQGVVAIPGQDAVLVATHNGLVTYSQGGGEIQRVEYVNGKLKTAGEIKLDAEWFGVPSSEFRLQPDAGRPDSFTVTPDGSILASGRGANGQLRSNLFINGLDYVLGPLGVVASKVIRYSWELRSLVCEYKDCRFAPPIKYPDFQGSPGFIAQVWTPDRGLAAGKPVKFAAVPYRQISGTAAPFAAPDQRGIWVDAGGAPLLIPMTPGTSAELDAAAGTGPGQVTLNWSPVVADGGKPVISHTATVYQGQTSPTFTSQTVTTAGNSTTFNGLTSGGGTTYFTVSPTNFVGTSTDRLGNVSSGGLWLAADGTPLSTDHLGVGVASDGVPFTNGGFDTYGNAYSWSGLGGSSLRWNGVTFGLGTANQPNFTRSEAQTLATLADGQTLAAQQSKSLGPNSYYVLNVAGAGVNGTQANQSMTLNYTDGTSETWTQSFSDWVNPQHYTGEAVVSTQPYADTAAGATVNMTNYVYGYPHPITQGKTLESVTLPNNPNVRLLDMEISAATTVPLGNALNTFGITTPPWQVPNHQGFDGLGNYYNAPNLNGNFTTTGQGSVPSTVMMSWAGAVFPVGPVPTSSDQVGASSGPLNVVHAAGQLIQLPPPPEQPGPCSGAACSQYKVVDTIALTGGGPMGVFAAGGQGLALSPDGTRLYALSGGGGSLSVVDTGTGAVVNTVDLGDDMAEGVAVSKDGTRLYLTNQLSGTVSVLDAATGAVTQTLSGFGVPWDVAVSPDGKQAFVSSVDGVSVAPVSVINTATNTVAATIGDSVNTAFGLAMDASGRLYAAADTQVAVIVGNSVVTHIDTQSGILSIAVSSLGDRLYVPSRDVGEVAVYNYPYTANPETEPSRVISGFDGPVAAAVSPDGRQLYVANRDGNSVSVVDTVSGTIVATLDVGVDPVDVAVSPDGKRVYVANSDSATVSVITCDATQPAGFAYLIGAGANGAQVNQRITMIFTDGHQEEWTQTFSDWATPGSAPDEAIVSLGGRVNQLGNQTGIPAYVYGYAIPIPAGKTLASLILPDNSNLGILGVAVV